MARLSRLPWQGEAGFLLAGFGLRPDRPVAVYLQTGVVELNMPDSLELLTLGTAAVIAGHMIVSLNHAWQGLLWLKRPQSDSITTEAVLVARSGGRRMQLFLYRFTDVQGKQREGRFNALLGGNIELQALRRLAKGDALNITYCRSNPALSYIEPYRACYQDSSQSAVGFLAFFLASLCFLLFHRFTH